MYVRDMSVPVDEETVVPPGLPSFRQGDVRNFRADNLESDYITTTLHVGTHVDAPYHFDEDGRRIGDIGLAELIRPTKRSDVREVTEPEREIGIEAVKAGLNNPITEGEYLFVHTGWADETIHDESYYLESPYYSKAVAEFVVESEARGLITDSPIDSGERGYPNHYTLLENDKVIVENVANLEGLPDQFTTYVVPINLVDGDGAPARVFLIQD